MDNITADTATELYTNISTGEMRAIICQVAFRNGSIDWREDFATSAGACARAAELDALGISATIRTMWEFDLDAVSKLRDFTGFTARW